MRLLGCESELPLDKKYSCGVCGKLFGSAPALGGHVARTHAEPKLLYTCQKCGTNVTSKNASGHKSRCLQKPARPEKKELGSCPVCGKTVTNWNKGAHEMTCTQRAQVIERMTERNPTRLAGVREALRRHALSQFAAGATPFGRGAGGNGHGPTSTELQANAVLEPMGFLMHQTISTRAARGQGVPRHYKLDFVHWSSHLIVEVDGSSHQAATRQVADARKTEWLQEHGFRVLRVRVPRSGMLSASDLQQMADWAAAQSYL